MRNKQLIIGLIIILIPGRVLGHVIGTEKISDSKVTPWIPKLTVEYQSVYHFGDSENESDLLVLFGNGKCYAQIRYGAWGKDGKSWVWNYENLKNVKIVGNKFYSDKTNGEFVKYDNGAKNSKGLRVFNSWSGATGKDGAEIGTKSFPPSDYFSGRFTQASLRPLSKNELEKMSKEDLKIMRNEIFARYGYRFKPGGEMDKYFEKQDWYSAQHDNVNDFLTGLEKENLKLIKQVESEKNRM